MDFSKFGPVETVALSRIKRLSGAHLHRCWLGIPHVTQFDEADITELDAFRKGQKDAAAKQGVKLTFLPLLLKAVAHALVAMPNLKASLTPDGEGLVLKQYTHIGVAVDTPNGLVVPVVRNVDQKGVYQLARELGELSDKARVGKLLPGDMQGGCFSISSLGGIGGTAFTPIVNAPEVAILGVSRAEHQADLGRRRLRPTAHAAPLPVLRPPGGGRCRGGPLHQPARSIAGRYSSSPALTSAKGVDDRRRWLALAEGLLELAETLSRSARRHPICPCLSSLADQGGQQGDQARAMVVIEISAQSQPAPQLVHQNSAPIDNSQAFAVID